MAEKTTSEIEREIIENYALFVGDPVQGEQEIRDFFDEDKLVRMFGVNIVNFSTMETGPYFETDEEREEYIAVAIELWERKFKEREKNG